MRLKSVSVLALTSLLIAGCVPKTETTSSPSPVAGSSSPQATVSISPFASVSVSPSPKSKVTPTPSPKKTGTPTATSKPTTSATASSTASPTSVATRTPTPTGTPDTNSGTITVSPTTITQTVDRSQSVGGEISLNSYTITSQGATGYNIVRVGSAAGITSTGGSGGMTNGSSVTIPVKLTESGLANGTYTQTFVVQYTKNGSTFSGPTVTYNVTLTGASAAAQLSTNTTSISETLSKANGSSGVLVEGTGFSITSAGATQYFIDVHSASNDTNHNITFNPLGDPIANGQTVWIRPRAGIGMPNGTYSSYVLVRYFKNSVAIENPITVNYTLTVTD